MEKVGGKSSYSITVPRIAKLQTQRNFTSKEVTVERVGDDSGTRTGDHLSGRLRKRVRERKEKKTQISI